jgi:hypothetical protein
MSGDLRAKSWPYLVSASCLSGLITGCGSALNNSDGLLGEHPLPAVTVHDDAWVRPVMNPIRGESVPLDRSGWRRRTIMVDAAQVEHHPSYGSFQPSCTALQIDATWPSIDTVFFNGSGRDDEAMNGLIAPVSAAVELVLLPFKMIARPPWDTMASPRDFSIIEPSDDVMTTLRTEWLGSNNNTEEERR